MTPNIAGLLGQANSQLGAAQGQLTQANSAVGRLLNKAGIESAPQEIGIAGFRMYSRVRERVNYQTEIPTSFVESGNFLTDHRIVNPITISIEGVVGDVYLPQGALSSSLGRIQAEVGNVTQFLPARTRSQISRVSGLINDAADAVRKLEALAKSGEQVLALFGNNSVQANPIQLQFIEKMEAAYNSGQIITVETRYKKYPSMVITSLMLEVNNETGAISFSIEFQEWREAAIEFVEVARNAASGTGGSVEGKTDKGVQRGEAVEQSLLTSIFNRIGIPVPGSD